MCTAWKVEMYKKSFFDWYCYTVYVAYFDIIIYYIKGFYKVIIKKPDKWKDKKGYQFPRIQVYLVLIWWTLDDVVFVHYEFVIRRVLLDFLWCIGLHSGSIKSKSLGNSVLMYLAFSNIDNNIVPVDSWQTQQWYGIKVGNNALISTKVHIFHSRRV